MPIFDSIGNTLKALRVHMFGKGIMMLAVMAATLAAPVIGSWVLPVVAIGGVLLTAVDRLYSERLYENDMVDLYRDDLAAQFGIAPEQITREHLKEAAKSNEVIDQALKRQRNKTYIAVGTAIASAAVTWLLVGAFHADSWLKDSVKDMLGNLPGAAGLASAANLIGIGTVAAISSLIISGGIKTAVSIGSGVGKAAAHDRILVLDTNMQHGRAVTKEQVYSVLVAGDPKLQVAISRKFHASYDMMNTRQQANVLAQIGLSDDMQELATSINNRDIRPGKLAYMLQDANTLAAREPVGPITDEAPQSNFVERMGLAPKAQDSYRSQIAAERQQFLEQGALR